MTKSHQKMSNLSNQPPVIAEVSDVRTNEFSTEKKICVLKAVVKNVQDNEKEGGCCHNSRDLFWNLLKNTIPHHHWGKQSIMISFSLHWWWLHHAARHEWDSVFASFFVRFKIRSLFDDKRVNVTITHCGRPKLAINSVLVKHGCDTMHSMMRNENDIQAEERSRYISN